MSSSAIFKIKYIFLLYNLVSFLITIALVICESEYLNDEDILSKLRPLKYPVTKNCTEFCSNIICETIKECKNGTILKKESYCNCCDTCLKYLDIEENCKKVTKGSLALGNQERCMPEAKCVTGKCEIDQDSNGCLKLREIRKELSGNGNYSENIWIPQCDNKGNFTAKQRKTEKSICVDESGNRIFGSAVDSLKNTCYCSRHMLKTSKKDSTAYKPQEHCISSGSFDTLQCINNLCYCADPNTGHVNSSSLVRIDFLDKLPCYNKKYHKQSYLKDCEIKLQRTRKIVNDLKLKNINLESIDTVKCDPDGSYAPVQRRENQYICTDKEGQGIGSYKADIAEDVSLKMTCNCAREMSRDFNSAITCLGNGSYRNATCVKDECFCLDQDGSRISKGIKQSKDINFICEKLIEDSFKQPNHDESHIM